MTQRLTSNGILTASVDTYQPNAEWLHFEDGSFDTFDHLHLTLLPEGESLTVSLSPQDLSTDSPLRVPGTKLKFSLDAPIDSGTSLYWNALQDPVIVD